MTDANAEKSHSFMPSKPQWDATVALLDRALNELAQAKAERNAARAEVARLTERINKSARALELWAHDADQFSQRTSDGQALISDNDLSAVKTIAAAMRQPAPTGGEARP